jgi:hypothetical protein
MNLLDMRRHLDAAELNFREASLNGAVTAIDELFSVMQALVAHVAAAEGVSIEEPAATDLLSGIPELRVFAVKIAAARTVADMTDAEIDRFFAGNPKLNYDVIRARFELYQPDEADPAMVSIRIRREGPAPDTDPEALPVEPVTDFAADGQLSIIGRGRVLTGPFPFEDGTDPVGKLIRAFGKVHRIRGFERFAILKVIRKDDPVGFLIGAV